MAGHLSWPGFTLSLPAYLIENLQTLYSRTLRGADRLIPGPRGLVTNPRRLAPEYHVLEVVVFGAVDPQGNTYADPVTGAQQNVALLQGACAPVTTGRGTRRVTWHRAAPLSDLSCDCVVGPVTVGERFDDALRVTIDLIVPATNGDTWTPEEP